MNLRIKNISAENCGPVKKINAEPGSLTLFYGRNEDGKSFLVEFIIRCLFKNKNAWGYLRRLGTGKITLTGIKDQPVDFKPDTGAKLENYFEEDLRGLPLSLLNLLVVKEGETGIGDNKENLTKDVVRALLSSRRILDEIDGKIQKTIQQAAVENEIEIDRRGAREYYNKLDELQKINGIISSLNNQSAQWLIKDLKLKEDRMKQEKELLSRARKFKAYTLSVKIRDIEKQMEKIPSETFPVINELLNEYRKTQEKYESLKYELADIQKETACISDLENKIKLLLKVKRYHAYLAASELKTVEENLRALPEEALNKLENTIIRYRDKKNELRSCRESVKQAGEKSSDYHWLKTAIENYLRFLSASEPGKKVSAALPVAAGLTFTAGIAALLSDQKTAGLIILIISAIIALYYFILFKKSLSSLKHSEELEQIKSEFRKRFGQELQNITKLESVLYEQEKYYNQLEVHNSQLIRLNTESDSYHKLIQDIFAGFGFDNPPEEKWEEHISGIRRNREKLASQRDQLSRKLAGLDTDETEYEIHNPGIKFDKDELEQTKDVLTRLLELQKLENKKTRELEELKERLNGTGKTIKETFRNLTGEEISEAEWSGKLNSLVNLYNKLSSSCESLKGQLSGLGVAEQDFESDNPGVEYSHEEMEKTEKELQDINEALKNEEEKLAAFKAEIRSVTGAETSSGWNVLIDRLYRKKEEVREEFEETRAGIIAGKLLHETIQDLQLEEDRKLVEALNSPEVKSVLYNLTGRYNKLSFDEHGIIISDDFNDFYPEDLSTGALEQVMIALRIGILKRLLKNDTAFLILDDAFQHSDYGKRELLVKSVCELTRDGWQIFYFTMDDHIRNLFRKTQTADYKEIDLHTY